MHGGGAVLVIGRTEPQEPSEGLMVFGRNMDGGEMAAPVEPGKHDGIEAIGLAVVTRLSRDE